MGHVCKRKYDLEHAPIDENQITFIEEENEYGKSAGDNQNRGF